MNALLRIGRRAYEVVLADCAARYPAEACGILIGRESDGHRSILEARPAANVWHAPDELHRRFIIDPAAQIAADLDARATGLEVIGFYHSHPDAPPHPSPRDVQAAWPFYTYLIVGTSAAGCGDVQCWLFDEVGQNFAEQPMSVGSA